MPRSKTRNRRTNIIERYFVTDGTGKNKEVVCSHNSIYVCLDYLRRNCSYSGRMYRSADGELLASRKAAVTTTAGVTLS